MFHAMNLTFNVRYFQFARDKSYVPFTVSLIQITPLFRHCRIEEHFSKVPLPEGQPDAKSYKNGLKNSVGVLGMVLVTIFLVLVQHASRFTTKLRDPPGV